MPKIPFWVFILLAVLYFSAIRVDMMDIDATQYANMSREMLGRGDYLHVYNLGEDYLDKPPFLFWVSSLSMHVFGLNNFGYKLPSILFALWALYAVYRLAKLLYGEATGRMAALILGTCQGMLLMTNDVRCDTILLSWVVTALWLIKEWDVKGRLYYLLLGCACIAMGMITKGPIALLVPVFCFASDWALKREWRKFFKPAYLLGIVVIAVLLLPMSIGLYQQFDQHLDKAVNGGTGVSGLRFFYWSQSFGRITGESPWNNGAGFDFLMSSMLWAFLPWVLLFLTALVLNTVLLVKQRFRLLPGQEWLATGGFILTYISLGSSKYQLPHYIFVALPLASIMVAALLKDFMEGKYVRLYNIARPVQLVVSALLLVAALLTLVIVFPGHYGWLVVWAGCVAVWLFVALRKQLMGKILWISAAGIMLANVILTHHFYYNLLQYQFGSQMGRVVRSNGINADDLMVYGMEPFYSFHFYAQAFIHKTDRFEGARGHKYIVTTSEGVDTIRQNGGTFDVLKTGESFKVSELTPDFLNAATRNKAVKTYYLLRMR